MGTLCRISCAWQNWPGAPGVSQFYGDNQTMTGMVTALKAFFDAFREMLPTGVTVTIPTSGDTIDDADGKIIGAWDLGVAAPVSTAIGAGAYAGNAGLVCHWLTGTVHDGRRIRGRTFVVPLVGGSYDSTGSLSPAASAQATQAAGSLVTSTAGIFKVWRRPKYAKPKTTPPTIIRPGTSAPVTSARVPDLAVSLRSRRT